MPKTTKNLKFEYSKELYSKKYNKIVGKFNKDFSESLKVSKENLRIPFTIFVKDQNKIIGGIFGFSEFKWLYIDSMYVNKNYRKMGLGTKLLSNAENLAEKRSCLGIKFECFESNFHYYKSKGYKIYYIEKRPKQIQIFYLKKLIIYDQ